MEKFYLKSIDDFFSIIDNIKSSQDLNIVLIVPSGTIALRSIINLRILKEESSFLNKNIYISTSDELIKKLAKQADIKILNPQGLGTTKKPEKIMDRIVDLRIMSDVVRPQEERIEEPVIEVDSEPVFEPQSKKDYFYKERSSEEKVFAEPLPERSYKIRKARSFKIFTPKFFIGFLILLGILGLAYVIYFVLPRAQVIINPKKEKVKFETEITVDKNISAVDTEMSKIPGQYFETENTKSREFQSTGQRDVLEKAKGKITIYNQYSSSPQTLVKTTRLTSADGKIFRLISTVTIPGAIIDQGKIVASSKEVDVEADQPGSDYNIGPSDFKIPGFEGTPKYTAFYGKSTQPMTGGAKGVMKVATQDDITGATNIVALAAKDTITKDFQALIPKDLKLLSDSQLLETTESSSTLKANQPGDKFTITVKMKAAGIAFKEQDTLYLISKNVGNNISSNKTLLFSTIKVDYKTLKLNLKQGTADLNCSVEADAAWSFDEQKIRNDLVGKSEADVKTYLSALPEIETAKIVFWPFWVKSVPNNINRIKVITSIK